jgi:hypothetical protein
MTSGPSSPQSILGRIVILNETADWILPPEFQPYVLRIDAAYLYDRHKATHCCEITPSRWLVHLEDSAVLIPGLKEALAESLRERIDDWLRFTEQTNGIYVHCHRADSLPGMDLEEEPIPEGTPYDEAFQAILEHIQANSCMIPYKG